MLVGDEVDVGLMEFEVVFKLSSQQTCQPHY